MYPYNTHTLRLQKANQDIEVFDLSDGLPGVLIDSYLIDPDQEWLKIWRDASLLKIARVEEAPAFETYDLADCNFQYRLEGGILTIDIRDPNRTTEQIIVEWPLAKASDYLLLRMSNTSDLHVYYAN
jgi:hypothetical protein